MEYIIQLIAVGTGGFLGAICRFLLSGWIQTSSGAVLFPVGTLMVNMIGCFCIGMLSLLLELKNVVAPELRGFILVGLLGSFTTFSTFGNDTLNLLRVERFGLALINVAVQIIAGVILVWLGRLAASVLVK